MSVSEERAINRPNPPLPRKKMIAIIIMMMMIITIIMKIIIITPDKTESLRLIFFIYLTDSNVSRNLLR